MKAGNSPRCRTALRPWPIITRCFATGRAAPKAPGGKTVDMLSALIERNGEAMTAEELGQAVSIDHTGGYFSNMIGPLSTLGLIRRAQGRIEPTEIVFPPGLE